VLSFPEHNLFATGRAGDFLFGGNANESARRISPVASLSSSLCRWALLTAWLEVHHVGASGASFNLEVYQRCRCGRAILFYFQADLA
jgi:hypothetical protein